MPFALSLDTGWLLPGRVVYSRSNLEAPYIPHGIGVPAAEILNHWEWCLMLTNMYILCSPVCCGIKGIYVGTAIKLGFLLKSSEVLVLYGTLKKYNCITWSVCTLLPSFSGAFTQLKKIQFFFYANSDLVFLIITVGLASSITNCMHW